MTPNTDNHIKNCVRILWPERHLSSRKRRSPEVHQGAGRRTWLGADGEARAGVAEVEGEARYGPLPNVSNRVSQHLDCSPLHYLQSRITSASASSRVR